MFTNNTAVVVRRSARLASRFQPGRVQFSGAGGVSAAESRVGPSTRSVAASVSQRTPHRAVPGCGRGPKSGGAQPQVSNHRVVKVVLEKLQSREINRLTRRVNESTQAEASRNREKRQKRVAFVSTPQPQSVEVPTMPTCAKHESGNRFRKINSSFRGIRILQLNMRRSAVVTGEVRQLVREKRLDILLLQEPYVRKQGTSHTFCGLGTGTGIAAVRSQRPWAAVVNYNPEFEILFVSQLSTTHCACAEVQAPNFSFYVVSCYFQYSDEIEEHLRHLEMVFHSLRGKRVLVAVDANARSSLWGPQETDERGAKFEDLIRAFGMQVVNDAAQPPTYWTARGASYIDVTLASSTMSRFVGEWKVREDWTVSDHNSVDIRLRAPKESGVDRGASTDRFDTRRADWDRFAESLTDLSRSELEVLRLESAADCEQMAKALATVLRTACEASMPKKRRFRKSNPWWTKELTIVKKSVYRKKRDLQKSRNCPDYLSKLQKYRTSLREYSRQVRRTKIQSWRKFVASQGDSDPWGFVYKQQAGKLRVGRVLSTLRRGDSFTGTARQTAACLLEAHVPDDREEEDTPEQRVIRENARVTPETTDAPLFTEREVLQMAGTFKSNRAPGSDLIEVNVLKAACKIIPGQFVRLYNGCLQWGVFPSIWKEGSLRVLLKGEDKDEKDPKSYRPICLLSVVGKLFEKLIKLRLSDTSLAPGRISDRQFGFMPGRSTEDAVVELRRMVSSSGGRYAVALLFDISGAFDNVWWPLVLQSFKERDCPKNVFGVMKSYFDDRRVNISYNRVSEVSKVATRGCPQGSVLGPSCWNLMFDGLLRLLESSAQGKFAAYADDLVAVVSGDTRREIEIEGQKIATLVNEWCKSAKLEISDRKTEAIVLRNEEVRRAPIGRRGGARPDRKRKTVKKKTDFATRPPSIKLGKQNIKFKQSVRYLGVHLDREMGVGTHCRYLSDKVGSLFNKLGRLARAEWGLGFGALSAVYRGVFVPMLRYAAAGWGNLCKESDVRILRSLQRRVLIAVTGAYRTASWESLCVVAGKAPVDTLLQSHRALYDLRKQVDTEIGNVVIKASDPDAEAKIKGEAMKQWQAKWTSSQKGRTTFAFFGDVEDRLRASWIRPDRWTSQVLTGHGDFRERLASLGLADCGACGCGGGSDTAEHFLIDCPHFDAQRVALRDLMATSGWNWSDAARVLVRTPEAFSLFSDFCRECLWIKGGA